MKTTSASSFIEVQKFRQPWIFILLSVVSLIMLGSLGYGFYRQIILGQKVGNHPISDTGLIISTIAFILLLLLLFYLFISAELTTEINNKEIRVKFFPFHRKFHEIKWNMIDAFSVITYHPIKEYGGWGIRYLRNKKAYNIKGNKGLQLILKNGKKVLIGTQKENELKSFLSNLK